MAEKLLQQFGEVVPQDDILSFAQSQSEKGVSLNESNYILRQLQQECQGLSNSLDQLNQDFVQ